MWNLTEYVPTDKLFMLFYLQAGKLHSDICFNFDLDKQLYHFTLYFISEIGLVEWEPV